MKYNQHYWFKLTTYGLALLGIIHASNKTYAEYPSLYSELRSPLRAQNCGVNTTSFILDYFDRTPQIEKTASTLDAGPAWDMAVDLAHIKTTLESHDLHVESFKDTTFEDLFQEMHRRIVPTIVLIHLKNDDNRIGHYIVLAGCKNDKVLLVDVGEETAWYDLQLLNKAHKSDFSGYCLFVSEKPHDYGSYKLDGSDVVINLGELETGRGLLKVPFSLQNPSDNNYTFNGARGSCSCFKGAVIDGANEPSDKTIQSHGTRHFVVTFDQAAFGIGDVTRDVLLDVKGLSDEGVKITFKAHIDADSRPIDLTWFPTTINLGTVNPDDMSAQQITILSPAGIKIGKATCTSNDVSIMRLTGNNNLNPQMDEVGRVVTRYAVDFSQGKIGKISATIIIPTSDNTLPEIKIKVTGELKK